MSEEKYKIKFKTHKGEDGYIKSFDNRQSAELGKMLVEMNLFSLLPLCPTYTPFAEIIEVCPKCETENINTNGGDCYCAECGHEWTY